jgi:hypothetical protein
MPARVCTVDGFGDEAVHLDYFFQPLLSRHRLGAVAECCCAGGGGGGVVHCININHTIDVFTDCQPTRQLIAYESVRR